MSCLYFPKARDDRIRYVCSLLTVPFLVDGMTLVSVLTAKADCWLDELEQMSLQDGETFNEELMRLCAGDAAPDRPIPVQWIMFDLWERMRSCDRDLANEVLESVFTFMRAQTSKDRLKIETVDQYLHYRQGDVGQA